MKLLISLTQTVLAQYFNLSQFDTILAPCTISISTQRSLHPCSKTIGNNNILPTVIIYCIVPCFSKNKTCLILIFTLKYDTKAYFWRMSFIFIYQQTKLLIRDLLLPRFTCLVATACYLKLTLTFMMSQFPNNNNGLF